MQGRATRRQLTRVMVITLGVASGCGDGGSDGGDARVIRLMPGDAAGDGAVAADAMVAMDGPDSPDGPVTVDVFEDRVEPELSAGDVPAPDALLTDAPTDAAGMDSTGMDVPGTDVPGTEVPGIDAGVDAPGAPDTTSVGDAGTDAGRTDTPALDVGPREGEVAGVVPSIDAAMKARLRRIFAMGSAAGLRAEVFAKIGDTITASHSFLKDLGCRRERLGEFIELVPVITYFRATTLPAAYTTIACASSNAFSVDSAAAGVGWTTETLLAPFPSPVMDCPAPDNTPLRCELRRLRPASALVMVGTHDMQENNPEAYRSRLTRVVTSLVNAGVVPVLSTLPPRLDSAEIGRRVPAYNAVVVSVAREQVVPLWDYHRALLSPRLVRSGMSADGITPNLYGGCMPPVGCAAGDFSAEGLRYGYNQRNLTAVQILAKLRAIVFEDGPPDP